ncbi:MAG: ribosomal protein S18-alanine N-acetyltransferase [Candidatus Zixiibacteriota bacterium]
MKNVKTEKIEIRLRLMTLTDVDKVVGIEKECFPDPWPRSAFEDIVKSPDHGGLVAVMDDKIIGYGCYLIIVNEAHLTNLAVKPDFRRKSVAGRLLSYIMEIANRKGCEYILLEVRPRNESAVAFYEKAGFKLLYRRPRYYRNPVEDALVMVYYFPERVT